MPYSDSVSLVLITYNQASFIKEACLSVLNQDGEPIEIILSDDHSTDHTFEIMQDIVSSYAGPHKVTLRQTERNVGLIEHINQVVDISTGQIIVYAAGDDVSMPNRVVKTMEYFQRNKDALIVHSSVIEIDAKSDKIGICTPPIVKKSISCEKMAK